MRERKERMSDAAHLLQAVAAQRNEAASPAKLLASAKPMTADAMRFLQRAAGNTAATRQLAVQRAPKEGNNWDESLVFDHSADAKKYGRSVWGSAMDQMSSGKRRALRDYTDEPNSDFEFDYPTYRETNKYLRGQHVKNAGKDGIDKVKSQVKTLRAALDVQPIPDNVIVSRGSDFVPDGMENSPWKLEGRKFTELGFLSTSLGSKPVGNYKHKRFVFRFRVPAGTPAMWMEYVSHYGSGELELLLKNDCKYRVDKVTPDVNKYGEEQWYIDATILKPSKELAEAKTMEAAKKTGKPGAHHGGGHHPAPGPSSQHHASGSSSHHYAPAPSSHHHSYSGHKY
ncbi:ADP-ribosyltransferase [Streptomyces sp. NPDC059631]|uniref:ADP-ribosyltransferase n=1 Tax=unclassified Streptomyces TaxID=2593676 RepID=UPI0036A59AFF